MKGNAADKPKVLFTTEGSYPFHGGGVSTWSHMLCSELEERVQFVVMALTGSSAVQPRYQLSSNVEQLIHVPLWGEEEPSAYYDPIQPFSHYLKKRQKTTSSTLRSLFMPLFRDFIDLLLDPYQSPRKAGEVLYGLWKYYQHFDYKHTLSRPLLWDEFRKQVANRYARRNGDLPADEVPRIFDMTFGMRWLYHFMMPLAVPIPDVTVSHATLAGFPAITGIIGKYEYGIPSIVTDHGVFMRERLINISGTNMPYFSKKLLIDLSTLVTRAVYDHADQISPVASVNINWEQRFAAREKHIKTIYNGVDPDVFVPRPKPTHTRGRPTVVAATHLFALKDIENMIRSCAVVRREIPDVQYIVYGSMDIDPDYTRKCEKLVDELDLHDNFKFGGFHDAPHMIYNEGDISILSSISEGFPYTVLESLSCARPVVATDVGGIRESLEGCGILCRPRDPEDLGRGVIRLLKNNRMRVNMGKKGRERVLLTYTTEQSVDAYFDSYKFWHHKDRNPLKHSVEQPSVKHLLKYLNG